LNESDLNEEDFLDAHGNRLSPEVVASANELMKSLKKTKIFSKISNATFAGSDMIRVDVEYSYEFTRSDMEKLSKITSPSKFWTLTIFDKNTASLSYMF
jgi:hypothetical protein